MMVLTFFTYVGLSTILAQSGFSHALSIRAPDNYTSPYPNPEPCEGNCSWIHDPSIFYEDGKYWRFSTSGNIAVATAQSFEGPWEYEGALLSSGTSINVSDSQDIWAPFVTRFGDTYYCYYSVSTIGSQDSDIGVATSNSLQPGTWRDRGSIGIPRSERYNKIDPYVYQENESSPIYFMFGSYWTGIQQIEMTSYKSLLNWTRPVEDIKNVIRNETTDAAVVEGAAQWKQGDWYYIFYSVGACCNIPPNLVSPGNEYRIAVCRAESITGPYYDKDDKDCLTENGGTTILASHGDIYAPGGQGVMAHPDNNQTIMYYHYVRPSVGYAAEQFFFGFNYIDFVHGWPVVVPG